MGMARVPLDMMVKIAVDYEWVENGVLKGIDGIESPINQAADVEWAILGWEVAQAEGMKGWLKMMGLAQVDKPYLDEPDWRL